MAINTSKSKLLLKKSESKRLYPKKISSSQYLTRLNSMQDIECLSHSSSCVMSITSSYESFPNIVNIIDLTNKNLETVIALMRSRYLNKQFYTWAGQTLLAIHPYQDFKSNQVDFDDPSIDTVVSKAWFRLEHNVGKPNQSIVISGESGSGKTYSACLAMKYIATKERSVKGNPFENILWQAWSSVPLLTAFGNAPTSYNANSSRFGKLLQLQFVDGQIVGANIQIYLLEKSRVIGPNIGEGNFHIFRQVLDSLDVETLGSLYLDKEGEYKIAPRGGLKSTYTETVKALEILNIQELDNILVILSVILNLGNVDFVSTEDGYTVATDSIEYIEKVSNLLHVAPNDLITALCSMQFSTKTPTKRNTIYKSTCMNREECEERRNCIMKLLYDRLFSWLVFSINTRIYNEVSYKLLGLLDVYGFEVFVTNTFEQLCINYANERLQQYFVNNHLMNRRNELIEEGVEVQEIDNTEYIKRLALIDGPISIFGILNEECAVKRFNNDIFVNTRLTESLRSRPHFIGSLNELNTTFSIKHFAGVVKYDTKSMLCKNRDKVPDDIINFLKEKCNFEFLHHLVTYAPITNGKTLVTNFKKSLDNLMETLNVSDVHYIKCLKPNPYKLTEFFDEEYFKKQLVINGIHEIFKLDFQKYSIRLLFETFIRQFSCDLYNNLQTFLNQEMHLGSKHIYLTENAYETFARLHRINRSILARKVQFYWFNYYSQRKNAAIIIQRFFRQIVLKVRLARFEKFIDLSKKSSDMCLYKTDYGMSSAMKTEMYIRKHRFDAHSEGDQLSLLLEKVYNATETKPFKRVVFCGDRIVSYNKLAEVPVRMHTSKTCIRYSYLLPKSEMPGGLSDIF